MTQRTFTIGTSNAEHVKAHIRQQFETLSWWPTEEPARARAEFEAMQASPERLAEWCKTWLNGGQWRQLEAAVRKAASRG